MEPDSSPADETNDLYEGCKVLSFNDKDIGGFEKEDGNGGVFLGFDVPEVQYNKYLLDYRHHDDLPGLPRLAASADAGCRFCKFLRTAIQTDLRNRSEWSGCGVIITLRYLWHWDEHPEILTREQLLLQSRRQQQVDYNLPRLQNEASRALTARLDMKLGTEYLDSHMTFLMAEAPAGKFLIL